MNKGREIKFRVWSKLKNVWLNSIVLGCNDGIPLVHFVEINDGQNIIHKIFTIDGFEPVIQQFTGLKDKNGKEIYEGDILSTPHGNVFVEWDRIWYQLFFSIDKPDGILNVPVSQQSKIIGNTFENPELLK